MTDLSVSLDILDGAIAGASHLSNLLPLPIGTASAGTDLEGSRSDHVA